MPSNSSSRTKRNYTEKDLILKIEQVEKRIKDLTEAVRQLSDQVDEKKPSERKYVYGIKGIANLFDCSIATANRIKASGAINGAIIQRNRRIIVDAEKALELFDDPLSKWGLRRRSKPKSEGK